MFTVILRALRIIVRKDRKMKRLKFSYAQHTFTNTLLVINYRFKNALYYKVNGQISTAKRKIVVDISKVEGPILFKAVGLFSVKEYIIDVTMQQNSATGSWTSPKKLQVV